MAGTLFQDNLSPYLTVVEQGSTPATPSAGNQKLFVRTSDHVLCYLNSAGTVTPFGSGGSGSITVSGYTMSTARLLGRTTAATGAVEEISVGTGLSLSGGSLTATGGGGGSGTSTNTVVPIQSRATGAGTNTNALALTMTSTPTNGNLLIACIDRDATGAINNITQTNVTWTQLASSGNGATPVVEIWKGVVSASPSATLTINCATTTFMNAVISEWNGITGTLDTSVTTSHVATSASQPIKTGTLTPGVANALVVGAYSTESNSQTFKKTLGAPTYAASFEQQVNNGCTCGAGYAFPGTHPIMMMGDGNGGGGSFMSSVLVSIT